MTARPDEQIPAPARARRLARAASGLVAVVSRHDRGAIRLVREPTAQTARDAIRDGQAYAAILAGRHGESR